MDRDPHIGPFSFFFKPVTRFQSRGRSQSSSRGRGRGHPATLQEDFPSPDRKPRSVPTLTSHMTSASTSPYGPAVARSFSYGELFCGQGGFGALLQDLDTRLFDTHYWPVNTNHPHVPNEYR